MKRPEPSHGLIATLLTIIPLVLISLSPAPAIGQAPPDFDAAWDDAAAYFHDQMDEEGIVGGSFWLVSEGEVLRKEMHGFANLEPRGPVDEETIYHWASITKTFTGIAIMQLRDRGLLSLDDVVVEYLPALRKVHNPYGSTEEITIRHVMSHSAGFRSPTWPWGGDEPWHEHEPTEWSQLVAMMPYTEILFEPGSRYSYSNPGIIFLGQIIEQLTGDDYEVYVEKNIFSPLEMHESYFDTTPYHLLPHRSNNFTITDGEVVANGLDFDTGITVSNGGLNAPLPDMAKYLSFLMGACEREACENVLARSSLQEMWQPALPLRAGTYGAPADSVRQPEWTASIGLTYFIFERADEKIIGHTGSQKSFRSFIYIDPEANVAAIAAFNTAGDPKPETGEVMDALQERLFTSIFPLFR